MSLKRTQTVLTLNKVSIKRSKRRLTHITKLRRHFGRIKKVCFIINPELASISGPVLQRLESKLLKTLVHKGLPGYVQLSKKLFEWTFQYYGESEYLTPLHYVSVTRRRFPKVLGPLIFIIEKEDNKRIFIQFLLTFLSVYRSFDGSGRLDLSVLRVITDTNGDVNKKLSLNKGIRNRVRTAARAYFNKYDRSQGFDVLSAPSLFTSSMGPTSRKGFLPEGEFPVFDPVSKTFKRPMVVERLSSLQCAESEAFALAKDKKLYKAWKEWCSATQQDDLIALHSEVLNKCKDDDKKNLSVGRIGFKPDKGLKNRPYAMVNYWIQLSLGGIHTWAYSLLRSDKANYCFDHRLAFNAAVQRIDNKTLFGCLDETAATDKFSIVPFTWTLEVRFGSSVSNSWTSLMQNLKFYVPKYEPIQWGCGQPLGTKGSWPLYNVVSEVVDLVPILERTGKISPVELRVGDDTVFVGQHWIKTIRHWRESFFGVEYGTSKGIISKSALEFCKQYYTKYGEVTPLSSSLVDKSFRDSACFGMLVQRIHETMNIPYNSVVFEHLADCTSTFWSGRHERLVRPWSSYMSYMAILEFYRLDRSSYVKVVKLLALNSINDALSECENFRMAETTFATRVFKSQKSKSLSSLRLKTQDILTDPNPKLDWNQLRRLSVFRASWLKPKEIQRRSLSKLVDYVTISDVELEESVLQLSQEIFSKTGY